MSVHESSVNYKNLVEDLAQMYPDEVSEVIVSELIANALDSGADRIELSADSDENVLVVCDNGKGMTGSQFRQYHNFAAGLKRKGNTIGFAGVGAKISFNIACRVKTETRSERFFGGSDWYFDSEGKLVWKDIQPEAIPDGETGTRVEVHFASSSDFPYGSGEKLADSIRNHYLPLLDERFLALYESIGLYSKATKFVVNGKPLPATRIENRYSLEKAKDIYPTNRKGNMVGFGFFGLADDDYPVSERRCGVSLCTYGKVIKSDFLRQYPGQYAPRILGVVEIPRLIEFLNTSKSDFSRPRGRGKVLESLLDLVRQEFKEWLADIGVSDVDRNEDAAEAAKIEREISKIISEVPELSEFLGSTNRNKNNVLEQSGQGELEGHFEPLADAVPVDSAGRTARGTEREAEPEVSESDSGEPLGEGGDERARSISRKVRTGPRIAFSSRPDQVELAWVEGNSIIINSGHPSYEKAKTNSASRILHNLFSIGSAVQKLLLLDENREPDFAFLDKMMTAWGKKN